MVESDIAALERVILDRGHGSAWGCQFMPNVLLRNR